MTRLIYNSPFAVSNAALQSNVSITKMHRNMKDVVLFNASDRIQQSIFAVDQQEKLVYQYLDIVRDRILGDQGRDLENESRTLFENWRPIREQVIALVRMGQRDKAAEITIGKGADHVAKLEEKMIALADYARMKASSFMNETEKTQSHLNITTIIFLILCITMSCTIAFFTLKRAASAEKKLRESGQLLMNAIDYAPIGMVLVELGGKFNKVNEMFCEMTGYSKAEFSDMKYQEITHPDDDGIESNSVKQLIEGEIDRAHLEKRYIEKNGNIIDVSLSISLLRDSKGSPLYFFTQVQNITERKRMDKALKESEKKYQNFFNNAQVALFRTSIEGGILEINKRYAEISGYPTIEACMAEFNPGKAWADPNQRNALLNILQEKKFVSDYETKIFRRDGAHIWILFSATLYPEKGFIEGSLVEITDRKKAEKEIRELNRNLELRVYQRTARLEEVNKELEDFVYSVSHDLRAPLRSISGFSEIINRRHKASLNEEGQHYFNNIVKASSQMGELIDDLLKFSRLGRLSIKSEKILLKDVFKTAIKTLSGEIEKTGARINVAEQMPAVQGDLTLTTHVFINLLGNALKYQKPDIPPVVDVGFEIKPPHVIISVADNGIGIDPVYHEKIFNIFQRLHSQTEYSGTGIGLAAVKKALQIMKGQVKVESEPDKGSVFKVTILMAATESTKGTQQ